MDWPKHYDNNNKKKNKKTKTIIRTIREMNVLIFYSSLANFRMAHCYSLQINDISLAITDVARAVPHSSTNQRRLAAY